MALRPVTVGRALALLLAGIGIGAVIFVFLRLRPDALKAQVEEALHDMLVGRSEVKEVLLDLDRGVELVGVRIFYADGTPAVEAESIAIAVDQRRLLSGDVVIRQVELRGAQLHLRGHDGDHWSNPLEGLIHPMEDKPMDRDFRPPVVRILPGRGGSGVEILRAPLLSDDLPLHLGIRSLDAYPEGTRYRVHVEFAAERFEKAHVDLHLDFREGAAEAEAHIEGLRWRREDKARLAAPLRSALVAIEVGGKATVDAKVTARLSPFALEGVRCVAALSDVAGAFGDIHTGDPAGLPFQISKGAGTLSFEGDRLVLPDLRAEYRNPEGIAGTVAVSLGLGFGPEGRDFSLRLQGEHIRASTADLLLLLEPHIVETIVGPFQPSGTFDIDISITRRPGVPEKVLGDLVLYDGGFNYAGRLDELTGKRFGFHYPLTRCSGEIHIETNVPTTHGLAQKTEIRNIRGFNRIARPRPGGAEEVAILAEGRITSYDLPGDSPPEDADIRILVRDLPIDAKLAAAFASTPGGMPYEQFDLTGWAETVTISLQRDGFRDPAPRSTYIVELRDGTLAYRRFPLHVRNVNGTVISRELPPDADGKRWRTISFDRLAGDAEDGGRVVGSGLVRQGEDGAQEMEVRVRADGIVLGPDIEAALRASSPKGSGVLELWQRLEPHGEISAQVLLTGPEEAEVTIDLGGTAGFSGYSGIPCPVEELRGTVTLTDQRVVFRDVKGRLGGADFLFDGEVRPGGGLQLNASVRALSLDEAIRSVVKKIAPEVAPLFDRVDPEPGSWVDLALRIRRASSRDEIVLEAEVPRLDLRTSFRGLPVSLTGGPIAMEGDHLVARDLWFRSGDCVLHVREAEMPREEGRYGWVNLDATDLHPIEHLGALLGPGFGETLGENVRIDLKGFRTEFNRGDGTLILSGALDLRRARVLEEPSPLLEPTGALSFSPLTLRLPASPGDPVRFSGVVEYHGFNMNLPLSLRDLSGELRIAEGSIGERLAFKGAIFGGAFTLLDRVVDHASVNIEYDTDSLRLGNLDARFYDGTLRGTFDAHLAAPGGFVAQFRANDVNLGNLLEKDLPRSEPMSGTLDFALDLHSPSSKVEDLEGRGEVRVREGQLLKVPGLRTILAVLGRVTPLNAPRFRTAEVDFTLRGEEMDVERIHLATPVNDVFASGRISIYGDLDLIVQPQVTRILDLPRLIDVPFLSAFRNLWHKTVYEIRLEGTIDSPAIRLRALPFLKGRKARVPFTQSRHAGRAERMRPPLLP